MSDRVLRVVGAASLVAIVAVAIADVAVHASVLGDAVLRDRAGESLLAVASPVVGLLILLHRPRNTVGWLLLGHGLLFSALGLTAGLQLSAEASGRPVDGLVRAQELIWGPAFAMFIAVPVVFPDGRIAHRIDRWTVRAAVLAAAVNTSGAVLANEPLLAIAFWMIVAAGTTAIGRFVVRARRAVGVQRQQFRWVAWAFVVMLTSVAALVPITLLAPETPEWAADLLVGGAAMAIPVAIGVSVLRYRLWEIDRLINRAVVYTGVSVIIASAYLGAVVVLQLVTRPVLGESDVAVAGATLAAAAAFRPVRSRLQTVVDRRFSRQRYDAARTIESFGQRLRGRPELDGLEDELRAVVAASVYPSHVSVWHATGTP